MRIWRRGTVIQGLAVALLSGILLTGCGLPPQAARVELAPDETLRINHTVWNEYLEYLATVSIGHGAFVVAESGLATGYYICPLAWTCYGSTDYARRAINLCEKEGVKCVVFAEDTEIVVDYEIID